MTPETFTAEQLIDAANILLERIPVVCDCVPCTQERQHAAMLSYAVMLLQERDALLTTIDMLCKQLDQVEEPRPHFHNEAFRPLPVDHENPDR